LYGTSINDRKQNVYQEVKNFNDKWNKPVFFGELGFPRRNGAAAHPWDHQVSEMENTVEQAHAFSAYRKVFSQESWLWGFSVFAIGVPERDSVFYPGEESIQIIKGW
jgi:hypothetical protein